MPAECEFLASAAEDGTVRVWQRACRCVAVLQCCAPPAAVRSLAAWGSSGCAGLAAGCSDGLLAVWRQRQDEDALCRPQDPAVRETEAENALLLSLRGLRHVRARRAALAPHLLQPLRGASEGEAGLRAELVALEAAHLDALRVLPTHACSSSDSFFCAFCSDGGGGDGGGGARRALRLPCRHSFHADCILDWLVESGACPVCRSAVGEGEAGSSPARGAAAAQSRSPVAFNLHERDDAPLK